MERRSRTILQSVLVGYLVLLLASIVTGDPVVTTAADLGFAAVAGYFGYTVYANRSPSEDERVVYVTAAALVLAGLAQLLALVPGFGAAALASTAFFVVGFVGYFYLRWR
ncbi:hypothetical protein [Halobellus limi]|uniref:Uncharacterized protein n=1 Tax=Halobellus limi TaxID=699433 RepID=A0A1H5YW05_9EURY|nr:hypothetical protein [Halobellus limi]QCC48338.1 hypothetical protein DV707_12075 [Halobellus limi]SEG27426.1 hypothetical protein SAMN04488133_1719 [Halobellus limi]